MFTGIVTSVGVIVAIVHLDKGVRLRIQASSDFSSLNPGASVSCSGICLTVSGISKNSSSKIEFEVEVWKETLELTTAASWGEGTFINLERSLKTGDELGGHWVSGHVDGTAEIVEKTEEGGATRFIIEAPKQLMKFIAPKGSITLDGLSLTVNTVKDFTFDVLLIAHSLKTTSWRNRQKGDYLNIEVDLLARYIARLYEYERSV